MKRHMNAACLALIFMALFLSACNTRPILGDKIVTLYNSELQETKTFAPMDTMYVRVAGLGPEKYYAVFVTDAQGREITRIEVQSDERGLIDQVPLWYDMGLYREAKDKPPVVRKVGDVDIEAFHVRVKSLSDGQTDFRQPMWIRFKKDPNQTTNPKPVVYAVYRDSTDGKFYPENAFEESQSRKPNGVDPSDKTKVYVEARRIPAKIGRRDITQVDFYVLPFHGGLLENGAVLKSDIVKTVAVETNAQGERFIEGALLWDLNEGPKLVNPHEDNMAYMIVMDVDQNGRFDLGVDTTRDGLVDDYIDGIDGMGVPGFIVLNTPANDLFITIRDEAGNAVNAIPERNNEKRLFFNMDNIVFPQQNPPLGGDLIGILLRNPDGDLILNRKDIPVQAAAGLRLLPFVENVEFLNTKTINQDSHTYKHPSPSGDLSADVLLDLIVDLNNNGAYDAGDILIKDAVRILYVERQPEYSTCADAACSQPTQFFDESNTKNGKTFVYLKVHNMPSGALPYDIHVVRHKKEWNPGDAITARRLSVRDQEGSGVIPVWDLNGEHKVINPRPEDSSYDLIIDRNRNGVFDGDDKVLGIVILNTEANGLPRVSYANIASGGVFGNTWQQHWTVYSEYCDYRDLFQADGRGTNPTGGGYGVKAVFNPYFRWFDNPNPKEEIAGIYYGSYVDVYIVDAKTFDLSQYGHAGELNDAVDVRGRKSTLAIQPSCYNGAGMMTIWRAPMKPGKYYVIVDVNRNGRIDEGVDIIDAVNQQGRTIVEDASIVGFSVE